MKNFFYFLSLSLVILITSCNKTTNNYSTVSGSLVNAHYSEDYYFTINFEGNTYTSHYLSFIDVNNIMGNNKDNYTQCGAVGLIYSRNPSSYGADSSSRYSYFNAAANGFGINLASSVYQLNLPPQTLDVENIRLTDTVGLAVGDYTLNNGFVFYTPYFITTTPVYNEYFFILDQTFVVTVSSVSANSIRGTLVGYVKDGAKKVQVTGSFNLYKN